MATMPPSLLSVLSAMICFCLNFPAIATTIATGLDSSFNKDQDILILPLDLQEFDTHEKLTQDVLKHFGRVIILLNNAYMYSVSLGLVYFPVLLVEFFLQQKAMNNITMFVQS